MSLTSKGPKCECGWYKSWVGDIWQCKRCCPAAKTLATRALIARRKEINGVGYKHGGKAPKHCAPVPEKSKTIWTPIWAADMKEPDPHDRENYQAYEARMAIVAAVREARAARRRLKCIG